MKAPRPPFWLTTLSHPAGVASVLQEGCVVAGEERIALPRVAFVGRSNVGKSSLINALAGRDLARVSKTPGKTSAIQFFAWEKEGVVLVDLPGYGFARVSEEDRMAWRKLMQAYLKKDPELRRVFLLADAKTPLRAIDGDAYFFLESLGVSVTWVLTKTDALKRQADRAARRKEIRAEFRELGIPERILEGDAVLWVSSKAGEGIDALLARLRELV